MKCHAGACHGDATNRGCWGWLCEPCWLWAVELMQRLNS